MGDVRRVYTHRDDLPRCEQRDAESGEQCVLRGPHGSTPHMAFLRPDSVVRWNTDSIQQPKVRRG